MCEVRDGLGSRLTGVVVGGVVKNHKVYRFKSSRDVCARWMQRQVVRGCRET
jgi:hypothetical protein